MLGNLFKRPQAPSCTPDSTGQSDEKIWQPGDVIADRYKVLQCMAGSMGRVYIVQHPAWQIKMAIKVPKREILADRDGMRAILREANSWIGLGLHPNIASCYYVLSLDKTPHIFIEYVDGGSLADWIKAGKCGDLRTALSLAIQFCHGMEYTHAMGIIHRDIKPQNILLTKNALLKITDFGILLYHDHPGGSQAMADTEKTAMSQGFRGTPGYASPEQFVNAAKVDRRSDIFSFGICLWLMLCGRKPYRHNYQQRRCPTPTLASGETEMPDLLARILRKCVAFSPAARFSDFADLRRALTTVYRDLFRFPCPYAEYTAIDLKADSMNNRAVSYMELGRPQEAAACLHQALVANDVLPEALYNRILLHWMQGIIPPQRLLHQIEASRQATDQKEWFDDLQERVLAQVSGKARQDFPPFKLCAPRRSLAIYQESQLLESIRGSIKDHLANQQWSQAQDALLQAWSHRHFRRDNFFTRCYETLLQHGHQQEIAGVQRMVTLQTQGAAITHLAYLPAISGVIAGAAEPHLRRHPLSVQHRPHTWLQTTKTVSLMSASRNGRLLAYADCDNTLHVLAAKTATTILEKDIPGLTAIAFSSDGSILAAGNDDGTTLLFNLKTGQQQERAVTDGGAIKSLHFLPPQNELLCGFEDGSIRCLAPTEMDFCQRLAAHVLPVSLLSTASDGIWFASASDDRQLKVWDRRTGLCRNNLTAHDETIAALLLTDDGRHVISGCEDDTIRIWDTNSGSLLFTLDSRSDGITAMARGPRPHIFLTGGRDGRVTVWMLIYRFFFSHPHPVKEPAP